MACAQGDTAPDELVFAPSAVLDRIDEHGDLYAGALAEGRELPS